MHSMKIARVLAGVATTLAFLSSADAQSVPATQPAKVAGWRGDGSGRYPDANPPLNWARVARSVAELSAQAGKPKDDAPPAKEAAIPDGIIRNWLVLGPIPISDDMKPDEPIADSASLRPDEGDKAGDLKWQAAAPDSYLMDLCSLLNVAPDKKGFAAYAHAYIYSPTGTPVAYNALAQGQGCMRVWLNGAAVYSTGKNIDMDYNGVSISLQLRKGWNSLLVLNAKTRDDRKSWWISSRLYGAKDAQYDERGIVWTTRLPMSGSSGPVIMGDRLLFTGENGSVICADKATGKLLWIRTLTYCDFATDEERKANPELFGELDPLVEKLKKLDVSDLAVPWQPPSFEKDWRHSIEAEIDKRMRKVSKDKYDDAAMYGSETGNTAPTPVTDGEHVYVLFSSCIIACYDRDGNCIWKRLLMHKKQGEFHGYTTSPLLINGKLVVYLDNFTVLDARTGAVVLERPHYNPQGKEYFLTAFYGTGCAIPVGAETIIYYPNGEFVRLSDGKTLSVDQKKVTNTPAQSYLASKCATAVLLNGVVYAMTREGAVDVFKITEMQGDELKIEIKKQTTYSEDKFPYYYEPRDCASPLVHDGLMYCVNDFGVLTVIDVEKGDVVYQKLLDADNFIPFNGGILRCAQSSSPTLGGKRIYIWGNQGTCLVLEPGRVFKQLARNRLENYNFNYTRREATITNPVFEDDKIYYRGECVLNCIGSR